MIAALLLAFPVGAAAAGAGQVHSLAAQQCKAGALGFRQAGVPEEVRQEAHDADLHQANPAARRLGGRPGRPAVPGRAGPGGVTDFRDDYLDDVGSVDEAMAECVAETVDELLNPDDYADDDEIDDE
jgi:hypothetical protein